MTLQDLDKLEAEYRYVESTEQIDSDVRVVALCRWARRAMEAMRPIAELAEKNKVDKLPKFHVALKLWVETDDLRRLASVYHELTEEPHP